jgi:hypothetical protein
MNRLIIVGNGFDLAHGLETSYSHFIKNYLTEIVNKFYVENKYEDKYITVKFNFSNYTNGKELKPIEPTDAFLKFKELQENTNVKVINSSKILRQILSLESDTLNWVNIEMIYYQQIIKLLGELFPKSNNQKVIVGKVDEINQELDFIQEKLHKYLVDVDEKFDFQINRFQEFKDIFLTDLLSSKDLKGDEYNMKRGIRQTTIVNFNYTNTISNYVSLLKKEDYSIEEINIHGNLENENSLIFGFGDEMDGNYKAIEELNENVFFKHIKSFKYFQNSSYQQLIRFIEGSEKFEVYVLGHSLGLSDRTMLSEIFNSKNLERIKLFYYQKNGKDDDDVKTDDFTEKTHEISRHFKDNAIMRVKIVSKVESSPMPSIRL